MGMARDMKALGKITNMKVSIRSEGLCRNQLKVLFKIGQGILVAPDGTEYRGHFHCHNRHGDGKCIYANGDQYEGGWVNNEWHGHGMLKMADGSVYEVNVKVVSI
jgi:hypothetical protein